MVPGNGLFADVHPKPYPAETTLNIIVTCGPGYEPIDQVRRITNFSTGELGVLLANTLTAQGHGVICLKGEMASTQVQPRALLTKTFTTNDHLAELLQEIAHNTDTRIHAIFHVAALCDFKVADMTQPERKAASPAKIDSRSGDITLKLVPTKKIIAQLRSLFPTARIVGWKYELDGDRSTVQEKARYQMRIYQTDACVINGSAWGAGFGFLQSGSPDSDPHALPTKQALCNFLADWIAHP